MAPKRILLLLTLCCSLFACKKEGSVEIAGPGGPNGGARLMQMVYKYEDEDDSSTTNFQYDAAGRWVGFTSEDGDPFLNDNISCSVVRNGNGIIQSYTVTDVDDEQSVYTVFYDAARRQYTHRIANIDLNGTPVRDSTVFDYDGGRMTATRFLLKSPLGGAAAEAARMEYAYDGPGNLSMLRSSILNPQNMQLTPFIELQFEYDNKTNPLNLGVEALVMDQFFGVSPNNVTTIRGKDLVNNTPAELFQTTSYTYRPDNRPATATVTVDGETLIIVYKYS